VPVAAEPVASSTTSLDSAPLATPFAPCGAGGGSSTVAPRVARMASKALRWTSSELNSLPPERSSASHLAVGARSLSCRKLTGHPRMGVNSERRRCRALA
jgi:hypothetical protein